jgi:LacI family transcriptional regulator
MITHHGVEYYHNQIRLKAFKETLAKCSLSFGADQIAECCGRQSSRTATLRLLQSKKRVDGIIAPRDEELLGVLDAIEESNLVLGKDVRLISINETEVSRYMRPGISVIRFPAELVAREAFELLIRLVEGKVQSPEHILLPATIVERQSTMG